MNDHEEFFSKHLENVSGDLYNDDLLRARCPFCAGIGRFLVRVDSAKWRCEQCKAAGNREDFEKRLGISSLKPEEDSGDPFRQSVKLQFQSSRLVDGGPPSARPVAPRPVIPVRGKKLLSKTVQQRQIKKLSPRHHEIVERLLVGHRSRDIAKEMRIGTQWLSVAINSPLFVDELSNRLSGRSAEIDRQLVERGLNDVEREESIRAKLEALVPEALAIVQRYRPTHDSKPRPLKREMVSKMLDGVKAGKVA